MGGKTFGEDIFLSSAISCTTRTFGWSLELLFLLLFRSARKMENMTNYSWNRGIFTSSLKEGDVYS